MCEYCDKSKVSMSLGKYQTKTIIADAGDEMPSEMELRYIGNVAWILKFTDMAKEDWVESAFDDFVFRNTVLSDILSDKVIQRLHMQYKENQKGSIEGTYAFFDFNYCPMCGRKL